jgi:hypothetical protein
MSQDYKNLKSHGKKIQLTKNYGMFTHQGNLMVHEAVKKFKKELMQKPGGKV